MSVRVIACPDCDQAGTDSPPSRLIDGVNRREFLRTAGVTAGAIALGGGLQGNIIADDAAKASKAAPESVVKLLYDSMNEKQRSAVCFDWEHQAGKRGLLRTHVSNNWEITDKMIASDFYTKDQQRMIRDIFEGMIQPEWHEKIDKQLEDDAGGYGEKQSLAIFGNPGSGKFEFVMTGRHMTLRCDGNSADHVAFGGPIFYGHAASGFDEKPDHPGNVFWQQALEANKVYQMLDGKQREKALVKNSPSESKVGFQGEKGQFPGIAVADLSSDQKEHVQKVLQKLVEPYRQSDRDEVLSALKAQGGLDKCALAFYQDKDTGSDGVWDNWRLEGPSFVWYFRGSPHVHVWVNVASDPGVKTNAAG
ncbi:MAG: DUF3500 domain-containing protein [Pirellulales bacterium]